MRGGRVVAVSVVASAMTVVGAPGVARASSPTVVINEVFYKADDDDPAKEFVELLNPGGSSVDVSGWCVDGIGYCFPAASSIPAGGFRVLTPADYPGSLSNSGEHLRLLDASSFVVDDVEYDDHGVWPAMADGEGGSLERRDPSLPGNDPGNWMSSPTPSRGTANTMAAAGLLPVFRSVVHTVLPAANTPIAVGADLDHATSATLVYRIGFAAEVSVPMSVVAGHATASIPGQAAGALVRYRLTATEVGRTGTWPRQGDGSNYTGTTVADSVTSALPRFQWFMEDAVYAKAYKDLRLHGDEGYPCVIAYGGEIIDNTLVRVKGQVSRHATKKKWKFSLAAGHELAIPGLLPVPVDEFAMHSSATDKSFLRETLASEWMTAAGVLGTQQIFPARLEKNGAFYGLYSYVEQPDGSWRDRFGYDDEDAIVYEGGANQPNVVLAIGDASLSQARLRYRYDKETREYEDDADLRLLIRKINGLKGAARRAWLYDHVDLPQVINALAADAVIQHSDFGHKNYRLVLGASGRWQVIPNDFDLTWGRVYTASAGAYSSEVGSRASYMNASGNRLVGAIWSDPELKAMFDRRVRTLTDELLGPEPIESRVTELVAAVAPEAALDRAIWGTYGERQSPQAAQYDILGAYVPFRRRFLLGAVTSRLGPPQRAVPGVVISAVDAAPTGGAPQWVELHNPTSASVDLSGWVLQPLGTVLPPGVVLAPGQRVRLVDDITKDTAASLGGTYVPAAFAGDLPDGGGTLTLVTAAGDVVAHLDYGTPPTPTPYVIVNEINAVSSANLPGNGPDPFWGSVPTGNGNDWVELVVVSDHTDLRGWHVRVVDNAQPAVDLVLPSVAGLADVRAGTILTISEDLATDLTVDPDGGDWWMNLQLTGFDTSNSGTQVEIRDAADVTVFGPVGEGVNPVSGVGSDEVARLDVSPSASVTAASPYVDSKTSSFGAPNPLTAGGSQDFSALRAPVVIVPDTSPPSNVTGLSASANTGRTATLTWTAATDDHAVTGYRVFVNGRLVATPAGPTVGLTALPDATTATVEVVAVDAAGNRSVVPVVLALTLADASPPSPPRNVGGTRTRTTIKVYWGAAADLSGTASATVEMVGGPTLTTTGHRVTFAGLTPNTEYTFRIRVTDRRGVQGWPVTVVIKTR